jgi:hypothetical protein
VFEKKRPAFVRLADVHGGDLLLMLVEHGVTHTYIQIATAAFCGE